MSCKVISVIDDTNRAKDLEQSLIKYGWDYHFIVTKWKGFGTKLNAINDYLSWNPNIEDFIFLDGYDCLAIQSPDKFYPHHDSLISTEVNCWPDADRVNEYPKSKLKFRFVNSGSYYMKSKLFKSLIKNSPINNEDDDQRWMTTQAITHSLILDTRREVFQTLCGIIPNEDYVISNGRFITNEGTRPIFLHGNGKADMKHYLHL